MKKMTIFLKFSVVILVFFSLSCDFGLPEGNTGDADEDLTVLNALNPASDLDGDDVPNATDPDIDGDGISNDEEEFYNTSAYIQDTDGDGWSDYEEVGRFVASENKFNPAIADLPRIELILKSEPLVKMQYETTSGKSVDYSTATSESYEESHTSSNSFSHSFGTEHGWSVETGVQISWGVDDSGLSAYSGGEWHLNVGASGSYTTEDTHEWGVEESYTNARSVESAKTISTSEDLTKTGGSITYSVAFKNTGPMAYTVDTMELTASKVDLNNDALIGSISQQSNSSFSEFQSFLLNPGQESGTFSFRNDSLYVSDVMDLLSNSSSIICSISGYTISMEETNFTQSGTDVPAKTAKLYIDYGPGQMVESEQYCVATKTRINTSATNLFELYSPLPLSEIMETINVEYELGSLGTEVAGENQGLLSVRGVAADDEYQKYWYVIHSHKENNTDVVTIYAAHKVLHNFDEIGIETGDIIQLIYSVDSDNDGIPLRVETMLGTSDETAYSDGDSLSDWEELHPDPGTNPKTNPANRDTDGDGLDDDEDDDPLSPIISTDARLIDLEVSVGDLDFVKDTDENAVREYTVTGVVADAIRLTPFAEKNACPIEVSLNGADPVLIDSDVISDEFLLLVGDNTLEITVTALDDVTEEVYTLNVWSDLSPVTDFQLTPLSETSMNLGWDLPDDSRVDGILVRKREGETPLDEVIPASAGYSVTDPLGNGDVIFMLPADDFEERDDDCLNYTHYYYEIYTYHQDGSSYTWSPPAAADSRTVSRTNARFYFRLHWLQVTKKESGLRPTPDLYWKIFIRDYQIILDEYYQIVVYDNWEYTYKNIPYLEYYHFHDGTTDAGAPYESEYKETDLFVYRSYGSRVTLDVSIIDYKDYNWDWGTGDDEPLTLSTYDFVYDFDSNQWSAEGIPGFESIAPGENDIRYHTFTFNESNDAECKLKMSFWWEELD